MLNLCLCCGTSLETRSLHYRIIVPAFNRLQTEFMAFVGNRNGVSAHIVIFVVHLTHCLLGSSFIAVQQYKMFVSVALLLGCGTAFSLCVYS
jgi:hypothetical protein